MSIGDALAIALMKEKNFGKLDFKKFHPSGNLGNKLKTAGDLMLIRKKIPFINENQIMRKALKTLNLKRLGFLVVTNNSGFTTGVFTDGDLKRLMQKKRLIDHIKIKSLMTKNPFSVEKNTLISDILFQMNKKKITNACVHNFDNKKKTIGVIHIHDLVNNIN